MTHSFLPKRFKYSELGIASVMGEMVLGKFIPTYAKPVQFGAACALNSKLATFKEHIDRCKMFDDTSNDDLYKMVCW